jgi:hypothetical protein
LATAVPPSRNHRYLTNTGPALSTRDIANNSSHHRRVVFGESRSGAFACALATDSDESARRSHVEPPGASRRRSLDPHPRGGLFAMRQRSLLGGLLGLLILLSSSAAASPWHLIIVLGLLTLPLLPVTLIGADACFRWGVSAWTIQVPIILLPLIAAAIWLQRERWRGRKRIRTLVVPYVILTFGTNVAAYTWFQVDHSGDHPIAAVLGEHLSPSRLATVTVTATDVQQLLGPPLARGVFSTNDGRLPDAVAKNMRTWNVDPALLLVYRERYHDACRNTMWVTTHYLLLDPASGVFRSHVSLNRDPRPGTFPD